MKQKKFINVGFEFTAALKTNKKLTNSNLELSGDVGIDTTGDYNKERIKIGKYDYAKISKYKWISHKFETDECGCEVPTPIIRKKEDVARYFNEFKSFVDESNLTLDIHKAVCGLGGCHIHFGIAFMPVDFRKRFLRNIAIYLTNHPQLNWGFNDVNDNINANSLLTEDSLKDKHIGPVFADSNIELSCYAEASRHNIVYDINGYSNIKSTSYRLEEFKDDVKPFRAFMSDPLNVFLKKRFALRYNEDYKTLELRIFDMPKDLKRHLLHYDVAMAIFNLCYEATLGNRELTLLYHDWISYIGEPVEVALLKFDICMKDLGINKKRTKEMRDNISTRHAWTGINNNKSVYKSDQIYLY